MGAHITYLSDAALHRKFGRKFQNRENPTFSFGADFQVESYLGHQGISFVQRFDANSYLYLTRAMDYFDLAADAGDILANAFKATPTRFCVIAFTSDWLFPTSKSRAIVHALNASSARVCFAEIVSDKGHDAFLLDEPEMFGIVRGFLDGPGKARGDAQGLTRNGLAAMNDLNAAKIVRTSAGARVDLVLCGRRWWNAAPRCLTSAVATANCCISWPKAVVSMVVAWNCRARTPTRPCQGSGRDPGRRRYGPWRLSE